MKGVKSASLAWLRFLHTESATWICQQDHPARSLQKPRLTVGEIFAFLVRSRSARAGYEQDREEGI